MAIYNNEKDPNVSTWEKAKSVNLKITCNGTEAEILEALRELVESYEQINSVYNYEDGTLLAELD